MPTKEVNLSFTPMVSSLFGDGYGAGSLKANNFIGIVNSIYSSRGLKDEHRDPENLLLLHNTALTIGYSRLISQEQYYNVNLGFYRQHTLFQIVDSLQYYYSIPEGDSSNYYVQFWNRRRNDGNAKVVKQILDDIQSIYVTEGYVKPLPDEVNDTLVKLAQFDLNLRDLAGSPEAKDVALDYFKYLKNMGLHQSAFNLIYFDERWRGSLNDSIKDDLISDLEIEYVTEYDWNDVYNWQGRGGWIHLRTYYGP
ncbi:MAG: hypothetical protein HWE14_10955 [Flavobacteriia bacterium]|nr:hypothetical protein [Flavobacteriia bacterium]